MQGGSSVSDDPCSNRYIEDYLTDTRSVLCVLFLYSSLNSSGREGIRLLKNRVREHGIGSLWYGAFATAAATFVGNYPW